MNRNFLGMCLAFLYAIASGISYLTVGRFEQRFDAIEFIFYNFICAAAIFSLVCAMRQPNTFALLRQHKGLTALTNAATASGWFTAFLSVKYIEPTIVLAIVFGLQPVATAVCVALEQGIHSVKKRDAWMALLIAFFLALLVADYAGRISPLTGGSVGGLLLAVVSGFGSAYNVICTKKMSLARFSVSQILALRFYLIILLAAVIAVWEGAPFALDLPDAAKIFLLSFVSVIIPLFLLQIAVEFTTPINLSFVTPFVPIFSYFIGWIGFETSFDPVEFSLIALLTLVILLSAFLKSKSVLSSK
jgi:drug/metabolite transporter (DMT)-like permease